MSIYYNHSQNYASGQRSRSHSPNQLRPKLQPIHPLSNKSLNKNEGQDRRSWERRAQASPVRRESRQAEWQDIANVHEAQAITNPIKKQSAQVQQIGKRKSPPKEGLKGTLAFIVNYYQEEESVAEITHYQAVSDHEDELEHSTSTIQSNERQKYRSLPRKLQRQRQDPQPTQKEKNGRKNRKLKGRNQMQDEFALQQKPKQEVKPNTKYLFYQAVQEQLEGKPTKSRPPNVVSPSPTRQADRTEPLPLIKEPEYEYQKGVHPPKEKKKTRLKNKLGFIFDLFHRNEEVASVSYYSESHESQKESMEIKQKDPPPQQRKQEKRPIDNIFHRNARQEEDYYHQPTSHIMVKKPVESPGKSSQFQKLNFPISPIPQQSPNNRQTADKQLPNESPFMKIKKSIKINSSLERVQLEMVQINRNRSRSKLSATKSVENKPKAQRYDQGGEDLQNEEMKLKKQSVDMKDLSRHIKNSINRQSSGTPSNQLPKDQLSKSKSASSKFSIKLMEMQLRRSEEKQAKSISQKSPTSSKHQNNKKAKDEAFQQETTVKKAFPIARKVSLSKNNSNLSKYMKIEFKDDDEGNANDEIGDEIPSIFIKKTDQIQRSRPHDVQKPNTKLNTNANTNEETSKPNFRPINKVDFNLERAKRFNTEIIPRKVELSDQQKKFLALLRKREDALLRRVKDQVLNNNPNIILKDNIEQYSKGNSNETFEKIMSKEQNSSKKSPKNYYQAERRDKMSLKSEQPKEEEPKSFFPTLNMSPSTRQQNFQTFYNNSSLKRTNSKNINYVSGKKKGLSQHISSDSERGKALDDRFEDIKNFKKQPSKISYYNIKKLHKESSLNDKNLNSKEKYQRLKQLLQQI